jgi:hypothetical protein
VFDLKQTTPELKPFHAKIFEPYRRAQENVDHQFLIDSEQMKTSSFRETEDQSEMIYPQPARDHPIFDPKP